MSKHNSIFYSDTTSLKFSSQVIRHYLINLLWWGWLHLKKNKLFVWFGLCLLNRDYSSQLYHSNPYPAELLFACH